MQTVIALLLAAAAACAIARPPAGPSAPPASLQAQLDAQLAHAPELPSRKYFSDYIVPRFILPHYSAYDESPRQPPAPMPDTDWLTKEIDRITQMEEDEEVVNPYDLDLAKVISQDSYIRHMFEASMNAQEQYPSDTDTLRNSYEDLKQLNVIPQLLPMVQPPQQEVKREPEELDPITNNGFDDFRKRFALTPMDKEYFENDEIVMPPHGEPVIPPHDIMKLKQEAPHPTEATPKAALVLEPPRKTRQNPNLSKQKHLLEPDLGKLKTGLANKDYRLPVSLLPTNLRWLKVNEAHHNDYSTESSHEEQHKQPVQVLESSGDPAESIYGVALIAAVGAALSMAIVGFAFGWYTLSKKAKAAADVDYPAYGVTGPTIDNSGDRKLAHSAHMYHYQHQKQQIIAMERNGMEQRAGSVSDPESEEENEEGDYTVYECPGFATTGDMEVKNPLFSEVPTPTTPGKCELVKPQPKD